MRRRRRDEAGWRARAHEREERERRENPRSEERRKGLGGGRKSRYWKCVDYVLACVWWCGWHLSPARCTTESAEGSARGEQALMLERYILARLRKLTIKNVRARVVGSCPSTSRARNCARAHLGARPPTRHRRCSQPRSSWPWWPLRLPRQCWRKRLRPRQCWRKHLRFAIASPIIRQHAVSMSRGKAYILHRVLLQDLTILLP